jgi:hypothetical protein
MKKKKSNRGNKGSGRKRKVSEARKALRGPGLAENYGLYEKLMKGRVKAALRKLWLHSELRSACLNRDCVRSSINKRNRVFWFCADCGCVLERNEVTIDHIDPVGDWGNLSEAMGNLLFCSLDNLQVLCETCHKKKTLLDNEFISLQRQQRKLSEQ